MKIEIAHMDFCGPIGFQETTNPGWTDIMAFVVRHLLGSTGLVELSAVDDLTISIRAESNLYVVEVDYPSCSVFKLLTSSSHEDTAEIVPMADGESLKNRTLNDLHKALEMVENYLETGEFIDSETYEWTDS